MLYATEGKKWFFWSHRAIVEHIYTRRQFQVAVAMECCPFVYDLPIEKFLSSLISYCKLY
jgi:hypothetical protein